VLTGGEPRAALDLASAPQPGHNPGPNPGLMLTGVVVGLLLAALKALATIALA
jgi:hypothetical protein